LLDAVLFLGLPDDLVLLLILKHEKNNRIITDRII
jgi:hypothetical protein